MSEGAVAGEAGEAGGAPAAGGDSAPSVAGTLGVAEGAAPDTGGEGTPAPVEGVPEWAQSFDPEDQAVVVQKGWKGFSDAVKAYKGAEGKLGLSPDQIIKLPNPDNPQEVAEFESKLGVPVDVAGYELGEIERVEGAVEADALAALAHSLKLPADRFESFVKGADEIVGKLNEQAVQERVARDATQEKELRTEWGGMFDENVSAAAKAMPFLGIEPEKVNAIQAALGYSDTMKVLARIGVALGEGSRGDTGEPGGGPASFGLTPEVAKAQLDALNGDKEHFEAINNSGHPRHAAEMAKRRGLQSAAFGGS